MSYVVFYPPGDPTWATTKTHFPFVAEEDWIQDAVRADNLTHWAYRQLLRDVAHAEPLEGDMRSE